MVRLTASGAKRRPESSPATDPADRSTRAGPLPPGLTLFIAVLAMSWGGPLVRFTEAPALVIGAWRVLLAVAVIWAVLIWRGEWRAALGLSRREWVLAVASGVMLAGHFWSWIASLEWTSVASSVVLVSTQPIFVALLSAVLLREHASRRQWAGIVLAVLGAAVIGWGDIGRGQDTVVGNALALAGAVFAAGYFVIGRRLRQRLGLWPYIGVVYGVAGRRCSGRRRESKRQPLRPHRAGLARLRGARRGADDAGPRGVNYALGYLPAYVANLAASWASRSARPDRLAGPGDRGGAVAAGRARRSADRSGDRERRRAAGALKLPGWDERA